MPVLSRQWEAYGRTSLPRWEAAVGTGNRCWWRSAICYWLLLASQTKCGQEHCRTYRGVHPHQLLPSSQGLLMRKQLWVSWQKRVFRGLAPKAGILPQKAELWNWKPWVKIFYFHFGPNPVLGGTIFGDEKEEKGPKSLGDVRELQKGAPPSGVPGGDDPIKLIFFVIFCCVCLRQVAQAALELSTYLSILSSVTITSIWGTTPDDLRVLFN